MGKLHPNTLNHVKGNQDILGILRVRISDPWKKSVPRKIFEILFWLETSKNDHSKGGGLRLPVAFSLSQCVLFLPKNALLFSRIAVSFSRSLLLFPGIAPLVFQKYPFLFQKYLLFIYCVCLFPGMLFFLADCTILSYSELLR